MPVNPSSREQAKDLRCWRMIGLARKINGLNHFDVPTISSNPPSSNNFHFTIINDSKIWHDSLGHVS